MKDFKVGDRICPHSESYSKENSGKILFLFECDGKSRAVVKWEHGNTDSPFLFGFTLYKEPLKYGSGEEVKVGDIIYGDIAHRTAQVLVINDRTISVIIFKTGSRHVWKNFYMMRLRTRLGELHDS